jgi:hypothetical protein
MRIAILLLGVSAASAGVWWAWHEAGRDRTERTAVPERRPISVRFVDDPVVAVGVAETTGNLERAFVRRIERGANLPAAQTAAETTSGADGDVILPLPTREDLEFRALKVEQEANHELRNLLGVLDLTDDQQDRVFAALARRSDYYHAALQFQTPAGTAIDVQSAPATGSKSTSPAPNTLLAANQPASATKLLENDPVIEQIPQELIPRYREYKNERDEFWAGVVEKIESQIEESGTGQ